MAGLADKRSWNGNNNQNMPKQEVTFANPKSANFTDPLASTNIFAHLISLQNKKKVMSFKSKKKNKNCATFLDWCIKNLNQSFWAFQNQNLLETNIICQQQ